MLVDSRQIPNTFLLASVQHTHTLTHSLSYPITPFFRIYISILLSSKYVLILQETHKLINCGTVLTVGCVHSVKSHIFIFHSLQFHICFFLSFISQDKGLAYLFCKSHVSAGTRLTDAALELQNSTVQS